MTTLLEQPVPVAPVPPCHEDEQRLVIHDVSWAKYLALGQILADRPGLRITYNRGTLELMTTSPRHELYKRWLGRFVETIAEELNQPIMPGGSMTFQRAELERGFEHDDCFWITNEAAMRGKLTWEPSKQPPPDLSLEIEVSVMAMARMPLFAAFRVPEIWCCDGEELRIYVLQSDGAYQRSESSLAFPLIPVQELIRFFPTETTGYLQAVAAVRAWVRSLIVKPS